MKAIRQYGFHTIELALAVLVVGVLGFAGYAVMQNSKKQTASTSSQAVPAAPEIKTADDLTVASLTVDRLDLSESSADLDSLEKELDTLE